MPSLIDLKTDLKSLRYGKDTLGGGNSGQPYIQSSIPDSFNNLGANEDFILRGGISAAQDSITDVRRLGKMFTDLKSPNGLIFIAKQQLLSRTAVRTQTSGDLNEGIYTPLNTLAQAGLIAFGNHLTKQGRNPFEETGAYANNDILYFNKVKPNPNDPGGSTASNRLVKIYNEKQVVKNIDPNIQIYTGGPGSILGIGNTNIRFADQRTGINNATAITTQKIITPGDYLKNISSTDNNKGVSGKYARLTNFDVINGYNTEGKIVGVYNFNVYEPATEGNTWPKNSPLINAQNTYTYTQQDIIQTELNVGKLTSNPKIQDFRAILRDKAQTNPQSGFKNAKQAGQLSESLPYSGEGAQNFEKRVNIGDPGNRANKNYSNYAKGVINTSTNKSFYGNFGRTPAGLDKINSLPIYRSEAVTQSPVVNDFVKFRIAVIDNNSPNFKTFMHFRAFLGPISDSYNAQWNGFNYLGRGEQFYTYGGFTRTLSLSWTVAAQSKQELIPMYKKLNYLASTLAPDYSPNGYMRGNLVQLTIGGYLYEQPGFITGLTYEMQDDSPWEIGIGTTETPNDSSVKELTQIIRVSGFNFTPIQRFVPRKQQLGFNNLGFNASGSNASGFVNEYGDQRFIALSNGVNNNYDS
jgi:hypothetical protein